MYRCFIGRIGDNSGVSWWRGYSRDGDGEQEGGGAPSSRSARVKGTGTLSILSASERGGFGMGEDMVVDCMMMGVG